MMTAAMKCIPHVKKEENGKSRHAGAIAYVMLIWYVSFF